MPETTASERLTSIAADSGIAMTWPLAISARPDLPAVPFEVADPGLIRLGGTFRLGHERSRTA